MMFNLISTENKKYVYISDNKILASSNNIIQKLDKRLFPIKSIKQKIGYNNIIKLNKKYYLGHNLETSEVLNFEKAISERVENYSVIGKYKDLIILNNNNSFPPILETHKSNNIFGKSVWKSNLMVTSWSLVDNNKIFIDTKDKDTFETIGLITALDIHTGTKLWQFNITDIQPGGNISRLIGVYQNILIAGIGTDWLLGIDTQSGKLVWKEKAIPNFYKINYHKGTVVSITSGFTERNIKTGEVINTFKDSKVLGLDTFMSQRDNYAVAGKYLITTDQRKGKIGAFNTLTHRFDWIHEEPGISFPGGHPIKYSEPYLFVMDNKHNLHIFEKQ